MSKAKNDHHAAADLDAIPSVDVAKHGSRRTKGTLPLESPLQREEMAMWVENLYAAYHGLIAREAAWLSQHPDDKDSKGKLQYYRHALAVSKQIAYYIRTFKLRGLA